MIAETSVPTTAACAELLRSLQRLTRVRRRNMTLAQDAGATAMLNALGGDACLRISTLAEALMIDVSAVSRQVAALEAAGLVGRARDEGDHRAQLVRLTDLGRQALARAQERAGSEIAHRIAAWSPADVALLTDLVDRLAADLAAAPPPARPSLQEPLATTPESGNR